MLGVERLGGGANPGLGGEGIFRGESSALGLGKSLITSSWEWNREGELPKEISESIGGGLLEVETDALREWPGTPSGRLDDVKRKWFLVRLFAAGFC